MEPLYYDLNAYFRRRFGFRVHKISVDAGLSCPNRDGTLGRGGCIYCNARGSGTGAHARGESVTRQIERGRDFLARRYKAQGFLAYFQSFSNTYAPLAHLEALYREALAVPGVLGLAIGTRPDCVDGPVLDLLAELARTRLVWVEYGLQSAWDRTLEAIGRGHDAACFARAVTAARARGLPVCAHAILGLPGEGPEEMRGTADFLARLPVDGVKLHLLYVVRGTPLEALYASGAYRCLEQEAYAELACDVLERLPPEVVIQRLTGDPHPGELVAPAWSLRKQETLSRIRQTLERRGTRQGSRRSPPPAGG